MLLKFMCRKCSDKVHKRYFHEYSHQCYRHNKTQLTFCHDMSNKSAKTYYLSNKI